MEEEQEEKEEEIDLDTLRRRRHFSKMSIEGRSSSNESHSPQMAMLQ